MSIEIDLDAIERAAKAATPGPWEKHSVGFEIYIRPIGGQGIGSIFQSCYGGSSSSDFVVEANPAVVLELVRRLRNAKEFKDESDAMLSLLAGCRDALGGSWDETDLAVESIGDPSAVPERVKEVVDGLRAELASYQETLRAEFDKREACDSEIERLRAELDALREAEKDAARLDFVMANDSFIRATKTDVGDNAYQLLTQNEDEEYITLSGDGVFFRTERLAIDAAMGEPK